MPKKTPAKQLREAASMKQESRKQWIIFAVLFIVCVAFWCLTMYLVTYGYFKANFGEWLTFAIIAGILGWRGNKAAKTGRKYKEYLADRVISDAEVKEFMAKNK